MKRIPVAPGDLSAEGARLTGQTLSYIRDVLRMEEGDDVELFDGEGRLAACRLTELHEKEAHLEVLDIRRVAQPACVIDLFVAPPKGDRWTYLLEKATEVGVHAIRPIVTDRTVVKVRADRLDRKLKRWNSIVSSAARQSERAHTPRVHAPQTLSGLSDLSAYERVLVSHPRTARLEPGEEPTSVALFVGPEGGFSDAEVAHLLELGAEPVSLGPRILRVETAAVVFTTLVQSWWGDL